MARYVVQARWHDTAWVEMETYSTLAEAERNALNTNAEGCIVNSYTGFRIIIRETKDTVLMTMGGKGERR